MNFSVGCGCKEKVNAWKKLTRHNVGWEEVVNEVLTLKSYLTSFTLK